MRIDISTYGFRAWISATDTEQWANRPGNRWPCSTLAECRLRVDFDTEEGLTALTVDGRDYPEGGGIDARELHALLTDVIAPHLPSRHPTIDHFDIQETDDETA
jgi:hypothetical protein